MGDLIMLHLNEIKRGQSEISLKDFESGDIIEIELDKRLTPHENASEYYNKSKRLERGINKIKKELKQAKEELSSLPETIPDNIKELKEFIDRHSPETGTRKIDKSIKSKDEKDYYRFKINDDYILLVGKNAKGNSYITFRLGKGDDLWFHTRDYRGAHGVLKKTGKKEFRRNDITLSASIVAFFSKAKRDSKVEVSYTRVKYVKKTKTEGKVLISNEKSLLIKPKSPKELDL
jgi:predicted ribosome quality control (RQC) complex YloA/Tae2 family protein